MSSLQSVALALRGNSNFSMEKNYSFRKLFSKNLVREINSRADRKLREGWHHESSSGSCRETTNISKYFSRETALKAETRLSLRCFLESERDGT